MPSEAALDHVEDVERAFSYWLNDHPVSTGDILVAVVTGGDLE